MGKWLSFKIMGDGAKDEVLVRETVNYYRVEADGKYYTIDKNTDSDKAYNIGGDEGKIFFRTKIHQITIAKPNRKDRRNMRKFYSKLTKGKVSKKNLEILNKMKNEAIENPEASVEDVKKEVAENMNIALENK